MHCLLREFSYKNRRLINFQFPLNKKGDTKPPFLLTLKCLYNDYCVVVVELDVCIATTIAATAAAATATVVAVAAAAPVAAPEAAAEDPAAPLDAPAEDDCAKDGNDNDITKIIVDKIFKIRIKLTPTFS